MPYQKVRLKYIEGLVKDNVVVAGMTKESVFSALSLPGPKPEDREVIGNKPVWI